MRQSGRFFVKFCSLSVVPQEISTENHPQNHGNASSR